MDNAKYVIVLEESIEVPIIFSRLIPHSFFRRQKVVAAGFVGVKAEYDQVVVYTWGESVSLEIKSRPEDSAIIQKVLHPAYY